MTTPATAPIVELNVNGILTLPNDADGWTDRAVTLAHLHLNRHAEKIENFTGVVTRMLRQQRKAELLAKVANKYLEAGWRVVMRGHSNGCDIIRRALNLVVRRVECAQFIAPAVDNDFMRNELNWLLHYKLQRLVICGSRNDWALKAARLSHPFLNLLGNSYGTLGLTGPRCMDPDVVSRVHRHWNDEFGHSDWLTKERLLSTKRLA
jgi:predicted alpha/beta hydrolase family esterase